MSYVLLRLHPKSGDWHDHERFDSWDEAIIGQIRLKEKTPQFKTEIVHKPLGLFCSNCFLGRKLNWIDLCGTCNEVLEQEKTLAYEVSTLEYKFNKWLKDKTPQLFKHWSDYKPWERK